jgi:subtilase family serine protease
MLSFTTQTLATDSHTYSNPLILTLKGKSFTFVQNSTQPPTDAQCRAKSGFPCYSPQEMRRAYGVTPLIKAGFTGQGQTIIIIDSFGSPTIRHDLEVFDQGYGLPDPPSFKILTPLGTVPFNPQKNPDQINWAFETTLDVEWAHSMAPMANIVLMTSPVDETEGVQGMPEFLFLEQYALSHHLGKIISQSWGATENTLFSGAGKFVIDQFEEFYQRAAGQNVTIFASSGDTGSANVDVNGNFFPFPTVIYPASSPFVTAVGGTSLFASTNGVYQNEAVWNNKTGATGGGISQIFKEPVYQENNLQKSGQALLKGHRGLPDIAYNADPDTSILVYISIPVASIPPGFYAIGGTSEGSPQWAGIIADGNQLAGHPLGFLNNALYKLGNSNDAGESFHDITVGNNSFAGIPGYNATSGWDITTGWGTPRAGNLLQELIRLTN